MRDKDPHAEKPLGGFQYGSCTTVEASIGVMLGEWVEDYNVKKIIADYREAISEALRPYGVRLAGSLLFGRADTDYSEFDLEAILEEIDFWAIAARHHNPRD